MFIDRVIGKYKVTRLIGEGGMASVYEAEHILLKNKVAIKILKPEFSSNSKIRERFKIEAVHTASLKHPGIIEVKDFEEQPEYLALILEYLEGEDLSQRIRKSGPLNDENVKSVFGQVLDALEYAHERGVAHRDIKPSNIFILPDGKVKILDFGIAKLFGEGNEMTQTGTMMGTPIYMSPEQVKGDKSVDHRSDIYSLGVTLYFAVTGKSPYDADSESWFLIPGKIVTEPLPEINSKYWPMICKACEKDRNKRYQECKEWLIELQRNNNERTTLDETIIFGGNTTSGERIDNTVEVTTDETKIKEQPHLKTARDPWKWIIGITGAVIIITIMTVIVNGSGKDSAEERAKILQDSIDLVEAQQRSLDSIVRLDSMYAAANAQRVGDSTAAAIEVVRYADSVEQVNRITTAPETSNADNNVNTSEGEVRIGRQIWMTKNLNVDRFRNGDPIPQAKTSEEWKRAGASGSPAWCYYNNDPANGAKYGKLYNWYAVNDPRGLAPVGYHIPSDREWTVLTDLLDGENAAGEKMKSMSGWANNGNGSNSSGFSGLPGGYRDGNGTFYYVGKYGSWWSSTEGSTSNAWNRNLDYSSGYVYRYGNGKGKGLSVRCLRD